MENLSHSSVVAKRNFTLLNESFPEEKKVLVVNMVGEEKKAFFPLSLFPKKTQVMISDIIKGTIANKTTTDEIVVRFGLNNRIEIVWKSETTYYLMKSTKIGTWESRRFVVERIHSKPPVTYKKM